MRFFYGCTALRIGSLIVPSVAPDEAQGCDRLFYGGPVHDQPMPAYAQPTVSVGA
jgi:hypothetical protein